jgi:general secretion pathway protein I
LLAEQIIADIELQAPDFPNTDSGDFGEDYPGYTWTLETRDVANLTDNSGRSLLKQIDLKVYLNDDEDLFQLRTYRLANPGS